MNTVTTPGASGGMPRRPESEIPESLEAGVMEYLATKMRYFPDDNGGFYIIEDMNELASELIEKYKITI